MFFSLSFFVFTFYVWKRTKINETEGQIYVVNFPAFSDITFSFNNDTDKRFKAMQKMENSVKLWKNKNWMIEIYLSFLSLIIEAFLSSFSTQYLLNEDQNNKMLFFLQLTIIIFMSWIISSCECRCDSFSKFETKIKCRHKWLNVWFLFQRLW